VRSDIRAHQYPTAVVGGYILLDTGKSAYLGEIADHIASDYRIFARYNAVHLAGKISTLVFEKRCFDQIRDAAWEIITTLRTPWPHVIWLILAIDAQRSKLLVLPYGITTETMEDRYNLLWDGVTRATAVINEYARCVVSLRASINPDCYELLLDGITRARAGELLRIVGLGTYLNGYQENLVYAWRTIAMLPGLKNKVRFTAFYFLPSLLPRALRKRVFAMAGRLWFGHARYSKSLEHVLTIKSHIESSSHKTARRPYSPEDL
jgi:hypothetical protein